MGNQVLPEKLIVAATRLESPDARVVKWRTNEHKGNLAGQYPYRAAKLIDSIVLPSSGLPFEIARDHCVRLLNRIVPGIETQFEEGKPVDTILLGETIREMRVRMADKATAGGMNEALASKKELLSWDLAFVPEQVLDSKVVQVYDKANAEGLLAHDDVAALLTIEEARSELSRAFSNLPMDSGRSRLVLDEMTAKLRGITMKSSEGNPLAGHVFGDDLVRLVEEQRHRFLLDYDYSAWSSLCAVEVKLHLNLAARLVFPVRSEISEGLLRFDALLRRCPEILIDPLLHSGQWNRLREAISSAMYQTLGWNMPIPVTRLEKHFSTSERAIVTVVVTPSSPGLRAHPIGHMVVYSRPMPAINDLYRLVRGGSITKQDESWLIDVVARTIATGLRGALTNNVLSAGAIQRGGGRAYYQLEITKPGNIEPVEGRFV